MVATALGPGIKSRDDSLRVGGAELFSMRCGSAVALQGRLLSARLQYPVDEGVGAADVVRRIRQGVPIDPR